MESPFEREAVVALLKANPKVSISFFKVSDGSLRQMDCTLNRDTISKYVGTIDSQIDLDVEGSRVTVWDLDKGAFRSFVMENLLSVSLDR